MQIIIFNMKKETLMRPLLSMMAKHNPSPSKRYINTQRTYPHTPLVLLPGTGCNARLWQDVLPFIPKSVTPITIDLLACRSKNEMLEAIYKQPYRKFALLGFSMGGYLAQEFYAKYPERISQLLLMCCSGEGYDQAYKAKIRSLILKFETNQLTPTALDYLAKFIYQHHPNSQHVTNILHLMLKDAGTEKICRQMRATLDRINYSHIFQQKSGVPCLVIGSRFDKIVPPLQIEKLAQTFNTTIKWVECGHMAPLEAPTAIGSILNSWITQQQANQAHLPENDHDKKSPYKL
jgi:pimeloyl-ACP methyl ester carboxylesterase